MAKIKIPGVIDVHVHLREPGATHKEDFSSGTMSAIAGGVTTVLDMPNNPSPTISQAALEEKISLAKGRIYCDVGFHFAVHPKSIAAMHAVFPKVFGYKLYMNPTTGNLLVSPNDLEEVFSAIPKNKIVIVHAEGKTLRIAIKLAKKNKTRLHVAHVSLFEEVVLIRNAKEGGVNITAEVTPHHLFLTTDAAKHLGPFGIMKPPLQSKSDQESLWQALRDGTIDIVATDHAPHTVSEKMSSTNPPFGVPGVETLLPLLLTAVHKNKIDLKTLITVLHDNPKKIFSISTQANTHVVIDVDYEGKLENKFMHTKSGWTPFSNVKIYGKVIEVMLRGKKVFDGEKITPLPIGKIICPL